MRFCSTLAFIVIVSVQTYSITAFACTPNTDTPLGDHLPYYPVYAGNTFPSNFRLISAGVYESFFEDPGEWEKESTSGQIEQIQFEVDEDFSYGSDSFEGQLRIWKPTQEIEVGTHIRLKGCDNCDWYTIGGMDNDAPPKPILKFLRYNPHQNLNDECRFGYLGSIRLSASSRQETPEPYFLTLVYVGETPELASESTKPLMITRLTREDETLVLRLHERLADVAPPQGFCLTAEFIDGANNRSPRSEPVCWEAPEQPPEEHPMDESNTQMEPAPDMGSQHDMSRMEATGNMMLGDDTNAPDDQPESTCATTWTPSQPTPIWLFFLLGLIGLRQRQPRCRTTR